MSSTLPNFEFAAEYQGSYYPGMVGLVIEATAAQIVVVISTFAGSTTQAFLLDGSMRNSPLLSLDEETRLCRIAIAQCIDNPYVFLPVADDILPPIPLDPSMPPWPGKLEAVPNPDTPS